MTKEQLIDLILKVAMGHHDDISTADEDNAAECAEEILKKFVSITETEKWHKAGWEDCKKRYEKDFVSREVYNKYKELINPLNDPSWNEYYTDRGKMLQAIRKAVEGGGDE